MIPLPDGIAIGARVEVAIPPRARESGRVVALETGAWVVVMDSDPQPGLHGWRFPVDGGERWDGRRIVAIKTNQPVTLPKVNNA